MLSLSRSLFAVTLIASANYVSAAALKAASSVRAPVPPAQRARIIDGYGNLPLSFEPNEGQADSRVRFLSRGDGYSLSLSQSEAVLSLRGETCAPKAKPQSPSSREGAKPCKKISDSDLRMIFQGSNPDAAIVGQDELPGKTNYFRSSDESTWHTNIANFRKVQYKDVYPGINLVYYGNQRQLEHDFIVRPGADPNTIRLRIKGAERVVVNAEGDLSLATRNGSVTLRKPVVYQDYGGRRHLVQSRYQRNEHDEVGFVLGDYDRRKELIIDPVLAYSGFFGDQNGANAIAVDSDGNAYVTGLGSGEFVVAKVKADGSALLYTSLFTNADPEAIAVDTQGNAYITGGAESIYGIPVVNALQPQPVGGSSAFLMKLDPTGSKLIYSTFFGGGNSIGFGVAVDASGSAYLTGISGSGLSVVHPISTNPGGFVAKFSPSGSSLEYSTYLAGKNSDGLYSIAVDAAGEAIVIGASQSPDFPIVNGLYTQCIATPYYTCLNTVVAKINRAGTALIYSTFLGAGTGKSIATNAEGDAFVIGSAVSQYFPVVNALFSTNRANYAPYVARINPAGSALVYSTFLGSGTGTFAYSIAVDSASNAYVAGEARGGFPNINGVQATYRGGAGDAFLSKIAPDGSKFIYSTFLGGTKHDFAQAVGVDAIGDAFIAGYTESSNFPLRGGFNFEHHYYPSYFIAKISDQKQFSITDTVDKATVSPGGDLHYTVAVTNTGSASAAGVVDVTSVRDRFRACTISNGDVCSFIPLGGNAKVQLTPLAPGEKRTFDIYATAAQTAGDYNLISNTATISYGSPVVETDLATALTTVRQSADIAVASSLVDTTDGLLHYMHTVTNLGPDNSHAVLLLDPIPAATTFISATTTAGECSFHRTIGDYGAVRCPLNNPNVASVVTVNIILQASRDACPSVTNTATITSQSIDANSANDYASVSSALSSSFCTLPPSKNLSYSLQVFDDLRSQGGSLNNNGDLLNAFGPPYLFKNGPYRPITLPLYKTFAFNDLDQVVGQTANPNKQVFQIYDNGKLQPLDFGELPTDIVAYPVAINNLGTIIGYKESFVVDSQHPFYQQSFVYQNGTTQSIFPSGIYARALNQKNEIAGEGNGAALLYSHGSIVASFEPPAVSTFVVSGLDSSGRIGGSYSPARSNGYHGYVFSGGHFLDLGTSFGSSIIVQGMNDCGDLVGKEDRSNKGFIYTRGRFTALDDLVNAPAGYFLQASHINNSGMILGYLYSPSKGGRGSFMLTPTVPDKCGSDATIDNKPDLSTITAGGIVTYTIKATNLNTTTTQFTIKDDLDPTTTVTSCIVNGGGGLCSTAIGSHTVSVALPNLAKGSTATITIRAKTASTYSSNSVLINTATLSSLLSADYLSTAYTSLP